MVQNLQVQLGGRIPLHFIPQNWGSNIPVTDLGSEEGKKSYIYVQDEKIQRHHVFCRL